MAESHDLGQKGEELAVKHLETAGYKILAQNWSSGKNEIDIIAENKDFIVFAEVKTRKVDFLMHPVSAVNHQKQRAIIYAASTYLKRFGIDKESRFDIITIIKKEEDKFEIDHIEGAFYPTLR
jgi:putative endonuclease